MADLDIDQLIQSTAQSVHRRYGAWCERLDVQQVGYAWVYANPGKVAKFQQMEDEKAAGYYFFLDLQSAMETYCRAEKATRSGYDPSDEATYGREALRMWLPYITKGVIPTGPQNGTEGVPGASQDPAVGGNWLASYLDVKMAWESEALTADDRWWLEGYYGDEKSQEELGVMAGGLTQQGAGYRISTATKRFLSLLNGALHVHGRGCGCEGESWKSERFGLSKRPAREAVE